MHPSSRTRKSFQSILLSLLPGQFFLLLGTSERFGQGLHENPPESHLGWSSTRTMTESRSIWNWILKRIVRWTIPGWGFSGVPRARAIWSGLLPGPTAICF